MCRADSVSGSCHPERRPQAGVEGSLVRRGLVSLARALVSARARQRSFDSLRSLRMTRWRGVPRRGRSGASGGAGRAVEDERLGVLGGAVGGVVEGRPGLGGEGAAVLGGEDEHEAAERGGPVVQEEAGEFAARLGGVRLDEVAQFFGLGGLAVFPLRFGAAAILLETATPPNLIEMIEQYRATVCFTAPTAYRVMLAAMEEGADLSSLRAAVSAGETLPAPVYDEWMAKTGKPILDGIGATELLHIFITNRFDDHAPSSTGRPVAGYEAKVIGPDGSDLCAGEVGRLAVRGPTGCRYLRGERQGEYVKDGWNITGDSFVCDEAGYFHFAARNDDMIISSGYNIAGPEVEAALLSHDAVAECAVIGVSDEERGAIVEAHVVVREGREQGEELAKTLQDHVKATIAPHKYPRSIIFTNALPKTETGKIQRFRLKKQGA